MQARRPPYFFPAMALLVAMGIGVVHQLWFFPSSFHGDAASMQVLAKAIRDEGQLLPHDFNYGNQLILWRASPFIAMALAAGFSGYNAFVVGSSLSVMLWGFVLFWLLRMHFGSAPNGLAFMALLLLPLGPWGSDLLLGQQSHLANAVLCLGVVLGVGRYLDREDAGFLLVASSCLFLMSMEAPIRGLLVLAPVLIAAFLVAGRRSFSTIGLFTLGAFVLGYGLNKVLVQWFPLAVNYFNLRFQPLGAMVPNFLTTSNEVLQAVSSVNAVAGKKFSLARLVIFGAGLLLVLGYLGLVLAGTSRAARLALGKLDRFRQESQGDPWAPPDGKVDFLLLTGALGVIVGAAAVAALNPDSARHYLWAIFLLKLVIFVHLQDVLARLLPRRRVWVGMASVGIVLSAWLGTLIAQGAPAREPAMTQPYAALLPVIQKVADETGMRNVYGEDYWRMMPLNAMLSDVNAQALLFDGEQISVFAWLTRPSWACAGGKVLYLLKDGPVDHAIRERLQAAGGSEIHDDQGYSLWSGPRVWQAPADCREEKSP